MPELTKRDPRYDILFEPVRIGPLTAKNRFYQVPHCNGAGYRDPSANAEMRRVKSEGGWAVVCTEQVEIHHSSEITPFIELRLWEERDMPMLARIAEAIHEHGALAGTELCYSGMNGPNFYSREVPLGPMHLPILTFTNDPVQARAMDKEDIRNLRRWHRIAAQRAQAVGFDLICVYGAHGFGAVQHFLSRRTNQRTDEYGGSLENRARLLKELIVEIKEAVGDRCAVPVRILLDEMMGEAGLTNSEIHDLIGMLAELPDLWDLAHGSWDWCSGTSRFAPEGHMEELVRGIKALTTKPVVGVGRFTSPDAMVRQVKLGILDFIGAARPSIADPFLPKKIEEGRIDDIRECIGCNICITGDMTGSLSRCTQNPTFMEEWRRGWHPERMNAKGRSGKVLVVGAGPAGLEAARALGLRGYEVALAEAGTELGGRVARESRLPGLAAWARVRDYRAGQIGRMPNVETYFDSALTAEEVLGFGFEHVAVATGSLWRRDGVGRARTLPLPKEPGLPVFTPDDLMAGRLPAGRVILYDDDHFYMGGVLAELLIANGNAVTLVTPSVRVSDWTTNTLEQAFIQRRLIERGVGIVVSRILTEIGDGGASLACAYTGRPSQLEAEAVVLVTARIPNDTLFLELKARQTDWRHAGINSVKLIGDALAPAPIAWAVHAGHRYARELDEPDHGDAPP
ncbi:MAG TPA: NAD(P)-binding protein, partial [Alphaproteobacteria bacterium]|nr:NAD(P)-binding protein [Alphaproteobacteria bacterium]